MSWLSDIKRGDSVMVLTPNFPPRRRKVVVANDGIIKADGMMFDRQTGTTAGGRHSLGPVPAEIAAQDETAERIYLATRVRNASTHELTTDQLRRVVAILDERRESES